MSKGKRSNRDKSLLKEDKPTSPFNNPFGALASMRDALPTAEQPTIPKIQDEPSTYAVDLSECGKLLVQGEKKGRAGKTVTRIKGLPTENLSEFAKQMKSALGCGATFEGDDLILLGALSERASQWLESQGAPKVAISGIGQPAKPSRRQQMASAPPKDSGGRK